MNCADVEILLAEYVDGTLAAEPKSSVEDHFSSCAACRELAHDAASAVAFMDRASSVQAPPELVTRILFDASHRAALKPPLAQRLFGRVLGSWVEPVLQPRWVMGMATTVLFFSMVGIHIRQLKPSDLDPVKVWTNAENRASRVWERGVKYYENVRLVYEIQERLKEWSDQAPEAGNSAPPAAAAPQGDGR